MNTEDKIIIADFGDQNANGDYHYLHDLNGYPLWEKNEYYFVVYYTAFMPWSITPSYYLIKTSKYNGSTPIHTPLYRKEGTDPTDLTKSWLALVSQNSGETSTGTIVEDLGSSSSSSTSSSSSSSSIDSSSSSSTSSSSSNSSSSSSSSSS